MRTSGQSFGMYNSEGCQIYGDPDNLAKDANTIRSIIDRQGTDLILEVIASHVGNVALKFSLTPEALITLKKDLSCSLINSINERT